MQPQHKMDKLLYDKETQFIKLPKDIKDILQIISGCSLCRHVDEKFDCQDLSFEAFLKLKNQINLFLEEAETKNRDKIRIMCPDTERFPFLKNITSIAYEKKRGWFTVTAKSLDDTLNTFNAGPSSMGYIYAPNYLEKYIDVMTFNEIFKDSSIYATASSGNYFMSLGIKCKKRDSNKIHMKNIENIYQLLEISPIDDFFKIFIYFSIKMFYPFLLPEYERDKKY